jgi:hypothetical protein
MIKAFLLLSALLASTCEVGPFPKPAPQPEPPSPWDTPADAAPPAPEETDAAAHTPCYRACKHLEQLGCPEAKPTAGGATCTQVCTNNESGPGGTSLAPECVATAESCSIARACGR